MKRARLALLTLATLVSVACTSTESRVPTPSDEEGPPNEGADVVFNRPTGADFAVFSIGIDGSNEQQIREIFDPAILSPDGSRFVSVVLASDGRITPEVFNADGSAEETVPIADPTLQLGDMRWSPDGSTFVAQGWDDSDPARSGLYLFDSADGRHLVRLTDSGEKAHDWPIAYSPDGTHVLLTRELPPYDHSGPMNLLVVDTDDSNVVQLNPRATTAGLTVAPVLASASWSPDGREVTFVASSGSFWEGQRAVFVVDADGTSPERITPWGETLDAMWSPDGRWIAFDQSDGGPHDLFVVHPDGTALAQITSSDEEGLFSFGPVWSPDGAKLLFVRGLTEFDDTTLWIANADGTELEQITDSPGGYGGYAWVPSAG
jgi:Tol biopolymer transport system component